MTTAPESSPRIRSASWLAVPLTAFALVALTVGLLARERLDPEKGYFDLFFSDTIHLKAWFATAAAVLALTQLFTAAWIFRKMPWARPAHVNAGSPTSRRRSASTARIAVMHWSSNA